MLDFEGFTLAASTADFDEEPAAREHADCLEFRMDLADDPLAELDSYDGTLPLLVTNRPRWEGGDAVDEGRIETLRTAVEHDVVGAVDVELASLEAPDDRGLEHETPLPGTESLIRTARERGVSVIVSTHDFDRTPPRAELDRLLARAGAHGDVAKLAVTAECLEDTLALLSATRERSRAGEDVATMAMGEFGKHTRAVAPVYGSKLGYAPVDPAAATAPGQYDLATLRALVDELR